MKRSPVGALEDAMRFAHLAVDRHPDVDLETLVRYCDWKTRGWCDREELRAELVERFFRPQTFIEQIADGMAWAAIFKARQSAAAAVPLRRCGGG